MWQSILVVTLIGICQGLVPADQPVPLPVRLAVGLAMVWTAFPLMTCLLKRWLKRGGRWSGQGRLFNLLAAASVIDIGGGVLAVLGVPVLLTLPLALYSIWIAGEAIQGAIPNASLGYAIAGIVLVFIAAVIVSGMVAAAVGMIAGISMPR